MDYKRARTDSQVKDRMNEILKVAIKIYEENGLGKMNFLAISKHTTFTRPAIYKYFETKEEIMLKMIIYYAEKILLYIEKHFAGVQNKNTDEIADVLTDVFSEIPEFMELYTMLFSVIKKNVSNEALEQYEEDMNSLQDMLLKIIKKVYDHKPDEDIRNFVIFYLGFASGLYSIIGTASKHKNGAAQPSFEKTFKSVLIIYLQDLKS